MVTNVLKQKFMCWILILTFAFIAQVQLKTGDFSTGGVSASEAIFWNNDIGNVIPLQAEIGSVSGDLYLYSMFGSSAGVSRVQQDDTFVFNKAVDGFSPQISSFVLNTDESYMYFHPKKSGYLGVLAVDTFDGSVKSWERASTDGLEPNFGLGMLSVTDADPEIVFATMYAGLGSKTSVGRFDLTAANQKVSGVWLPTYTYGADIVAISVQTAIVSSQSGAYYRMEKLNLVQIADSLTTDPVYSFRVPADNEGPGRMYYNSSSNIVYRAFIYGESLNFIEWNDSLEDLQASTKWLKSDASGDRVYGINTYFSDITNDRIFIAAKGGSYHIFVYHYNTAEIRAYAQSEDLEIKNFFDVGSENIWIFAAYGTKAGLIKTSVSSIDEAPFMSPADSSLTFSDVTSTYTWVQDYSMSYAGGAHTLNTPVTITTTDAVSITDPEISIVSDVYYQTDLEEYLTLTELKPIKLALNVSCSSSGATDLSYEIGRFETETIPSWLDSISDEGELSGTTPDASSTVFKINVETYLGSSAEPSSNLKPVYLKVIAGDLDFGDSCETYDATKGETCEDGYELDDSSACVRAQESTQATVARSTSQVASAGGAGLAIGTSLLNMSSPTAVWSMANQMQLQLLLILIGAYIPPDVKNYIGGNSFASLDMSFIPVMKLPVINETIGVVDFPHYRVDLEDIELQSASGVINNFVFIFTLLLIAGIHFIIWLSPKWEDKVFESQTRVKGRLARLKTLRGFKYGVYLKILIEAFQFLLITSIVDLIHADIFQSYQLISFIFAAFVFAYGMSFVGFITFLAQNKMVYKKKELKNFKEIFTGLDRSTRKSQYYIVYLLIRRVIYIFTVLLINRIIPLWHTIFIIVYFQVANLVYLYKIKPFKAMQDNIIETVNEMFFTFFVSSLFILNSRSRWTDSITSAYVMILMVNNFLLVIILFVYFYKSCKKRYEFWRRRDKIRARREWQRENMGSEMEDRSNNQMIDHEEMKMDAYRPRNLDRSDVPEQDYRQRFKIVDSKFVNVNVQENVKTKVYRYEADENGEMVLRYHEE